MKEIAEHLIEVMQECVAKRKAGAPGNFQGVLNQLRGVFDTAIKLNAGRDRSLLPLIAKAQELQLEGQRVNPNAARTASTEKKSASAPINMAAAFEFQKKRANSRPGAVVIETPTAPVKTPAPVPVVAEPPAGPDIESDTVRFLLDLPPAKFRDHFGGAPGLAVFAKETFDHAFDLESDDYAKMVRVLKEKLTALLPPE
jgi:hypothetical protein